MKKVVDIAGQKWYPIEVVKNELFLTNRQFKMISEK